MTRPMSEEERAACREMMRALKMIEVDLTAGTMPAKTRVELALHRARAALSAARAAGIKEE